MEKKRSIQIGSASALWPPHKIPKNKKIIMKISHLRSPGPRQDYQIENIFRQKSIFCLQMYKQIVTFFFKKLEGQPARAQKKSSLYAQLSSFQPGGLQMAQVNLNWSKIMIHSTSHYIPTSTTRGGPGPKWRKNMPPDPIGEKSILLSFCILLLGILRSLGINVLFIPQETHLKIFIRWGGDSEAIVQKF